MLEGEPRTFKEILNSTDGLMWKEAIKSEIASILHNHTWELVDLPLGCKPLSSKWVFKRKRKVDGSIDKYKAGLVIKCYKQIEGLDYFDTFSIDENKFHKDGACNFCLESSWSNLRGFLL